MSELQDYLKLYYNLGLSIIPEENKQPVIDEWKSLQEKRLTWEQIKAYEVKFQKGIGIICGTVSGNLVGIDFEHEKRYLEFFTSQGALKLEEKTIVVNSGHGGVHVWLREAKEMPKIVQGIALVPVEAFGKTTYAPEIDLLGQGAKMTAPPTSINHILCDSKNKACPKSGLTSYKIRGSGRKIMEVPNIINTIVNRTEQLGWKLKDLDRPALSIAIIPTKSGGRNKAAFDYARFLLFDVELSDEVVWGEMQRVNRDLFKPSLSEQELKICFEQAKKYHPTGGENTVEW